MLLCCMDVKIRSRNFRNGNLRCANKNARRQLICEAQRDMCEGDMCGSGLCESDTCKNDMCESDMCESDLPKGLVGGML